jgi:hypothetical protein
MGQLHNHAESELRLANLYDSDSDHDGMLPKAVLELIDVYEAQGHSGSSSVATLELFLMLAQGFNITPLTDDPETWVPVESSSGVPLWQNRRNSACFSNDGGKTFWDVHDQPNEAGERPRYDAVSHTEGEGNAASAADRDV